MRVKGTPLSPDLTLRPQIPTPVDKVGTTPYAHGGPVLLASEADDVDPPDIPGGDLRQTRRPFLNNGGTGV